MDYAIVAVPAAPVRRKPDHRKEMTNQLLFGESVKILKSKNSLWVKVRSLHDNYEGWMTTTLLREVDEATATTTVNFVAADLLSNIILANSSMRVPLGSSLPAFTPQGSNIEGEGMFGEDEYQIKGSFYKRDHETPNGDLVAQLAKKWENAPYLWGGRTPLGVDCSGFVQVVFRMMGLDLPRDAWQQAQEGKPVKKFSEIQAGDLAFFDNKEDIVHVGILLGNDQIIHASGKVRIDTITKKGIVNEEPRKNRYD